MQTLPRGNQEIGILTTESTVKRLNAKSKALFAISIGQALTLKWYFYNGRALAFPMFIRVNRIIVPMLKQGRPAGSCPVCLPVCRCGYGANLLTQLMITSGPSRGSFTYCCLYTPYHSLILLQQVALSDSESTRQFAMR